MQEQRAKELKDIEDQRNKLLRRQEKLKMNVLKEAANFRRQKAQNKGATEQITTTTAAPIEIKLDNMKNTENGHGRNGFASPARSKDAKGTSKSIGLTSPVGR